MSYTYDAGTSTPGYDGLIEISGTSPTIRLNSASPPGSPSTATFRLTSNPLIGTPPVRAQADPFAADDGGYLGPVYLDAWAFTLPGWISVPSGPADVPSAQEQLKAAFSAKKGALALIVNALGWPSKRTIVAQTVGTIGWGLHHSMLMIPSRSFEIPMLAADPLAYNADTTTVVTVTSSATAVTNIGSAPAPFSARFHGPFSSATLTRSDGAIISLDATRLATTIASGQYVDVQTNGAAPGGVTVIRSDGTNAVAAVAGFTGTRIFTGTNNWTASGASVDLTYRDAWG